MRNACTARLGKAGGRLRGSGAVYGVSNPKDSKHALKLTTLVRLERAFDLRLAFERLVNAAFECCA